MKCSVHAKYLLGLMLLFNTLWGQDYFLIGNQSTGDIDRVDPATGNILNDSWISGFQTFPIDMAVSGDYAYVANYYSGYDATPGSVDRITLSTASREANWVTAASFNPSAIALDATYAYVLTGNSLDRINLGSGTREADWVTGFSSPTGIALDGTYAYVVNYSSGDLDRITLGSGAREAGWVSGLPTPTAVAVSGAYVYVTNRGDGSMDRITLSSGAREAQWVTGFAYPTRIAVKEGYLYVTNRGTNSVYRIEQSTGTPQADWASGFAMPFSIAEATIVPNTAPTLTAFADTIVNGIEDQQADAITLGGLKYQGNEADSDGTVDAFVVQSISNGTLKIGLDAASATLFAISTNDTIDATHNAYWTPYNDLNGVLDAFTVKAQDDDGALSADPVTVQVNVSATYPEIDVRGNAQSIVSGDTTPSSADHTDFGTADAYNAGSVVRTFTIHNTSSDDQLYLGDNYLRIGSSVVTLSGAGDFTVTAQPVLSGYVAAPYRVVSAGFIPANGSVTFEITFAPTSRGVKSATVSIVNDDSDENPYTFTIQGEGVGDSDGSDGENMVPGVGGSNIGDGNGDGTSDGNQDNVSSGTFDNGGTSAYFTLGSDSGGSGTTVNSGVSNAGDPADPLPEGVSMPYGQFSFTVSGLPSSGATVDLELFVPYNPGITGYYKWNNDTNQWDELSGVTVTHYPADGKTKIAFSLVEGGPYDDDGVANSTLVDDGGPVVRASMVPLFGPFGALLLAMLMGLMGYRRLKG